MHKKRDIAQTKTEVIAVSMFREKFVESEFDLINSEALEEASQDYMRLEIDEVTPLEKVSPSTSKL